MLGKTAGGLYWMFRYLERAENMARLVDAGFRIALTRPGRTDEEWASVLETARMRQGYEVRHGTLERSRVLAYMLSDRSNPSSVMSCVSAARSNGRLVRTALTREVWEAVNESWILLSVMLGEAIDESELPDTLAAIRRQNALVRGALHGTMLRNDAYSFARLGTFVERADNTATILDVKYYVLLPSAVKVGSSFDNVQWESVLRSVSGQRAYQWLNGADISARGIADFLIFDRRLPRSLAFTANEVLQTLDELEADYRVETACRAQAASRKAALAKADVDSVFAEGLHEFLIDFRNGNAALAGQIEQDFRFNG